MPSSRIRVVGFGYILSLFFRAIALTGGRFPSAIFPQCQESGKAIELREFLVFIAGGVTDRDFMDRITGPQQFGRDFSFYIKAAAF